MQNEQKYMCSITDVVMDFDGTLTHKSQNTWRELWIKLGYDVGKDSLYADYFKLFISKQISHQQWCDMTLQAFNNKGGVTQELLDDIAAEIVMIDGLEETLQSLKASGCRLHIVSGNNNYVIKAALGRLADYFDFINANKFFMRGNILQGIQGTNYDFEGKAKYITQLIKSNNLCPKNVLFVGDGTNDEYTFLSGCTTLCINPAEKTQTDNRTIWNYVISDIKNFKEILPFAFNQKENNCSVY